MDFEDLVMKFEDLRVSDSVGAVARYWQSLPRDPRYKVPVKSSFCPVTMAPHLPCVFLSDWVDDDTLVIRLAGSKTEEWLTADLTGKDLFKDVLPPDLIDIERAYYKAARDQPCAGYNQREANIWNDKKLVYTSVILPIWNDTLTRPGFLGVAHGHSVKHVIRQGRGDRKFDMSRGLKRAFLDIGYGVPKDL